LLVPLCAVALGVLGMRAYRALYPPDEPHAEASPPQPAPAAAPAPAPAPPAPALSAPVGPTDLGVRFISRSPLTWRYNVIYKDGVPALAPTHESRDPALDKHWPSPGETVTFTAHVRNNGKNSAPGFEYRWYIDEEPIDSANESYSNPIAPGEEATVSAQWTWPSDLEDHVVKIIIDPDNKLQDPYPQNNTYSDYTNALSYSIWVEQKLFDRFNAVRNGFGTYSFDDWLRWQMDAMRQDFARSVYAAIAPEGIRERVRIEEIVVVPFDPADLDNCRKAMRSDPHLFLNDCRWQFLSDKPILSEKDRDWSGYVRRFATKTDWGLAHELSHQLGAIDEYRMNVDADRIAVTEASGRRLAMRHAFRHGGLMGGGYLQDGYDEHAYDTHTAGFLNRNLHKRRGYYGEFLFDVPKHNSIQAFDIEGRPLADAEVALFQRNPRTGIVEGRPVCAGRTDSEGRFALPDRDAPTVTTATGHTEHPNPFGRLSVTGANGTMLVRFTKSGQEDWRWLEIIQLNLAFWVGDGETGTYPFYTDLSPDRHIGAENLALRRPVTASSAQNLAANANDGDTTTRERAWRPSATGAGEWWCVDLGRDCDVGRAVIWSGAGNHHDWFRAFHFEISSSGAFTGEQVSVPAETDWDGRREDGDYSIQHLSGLGDRCVYTFKPVRGRYFRIISDVGQHWVQLEEVQVFEALGVAR
jgi:hypothetical protein